jgi:hypothetical protein
MSAKKKKKRRVQFRLQKQKTKAGQLIKKTGRKLKKNSAIRVEGDLSVVIHRENYSWNLDRFNQNLIGVQIADRNFVGKKRFGFPHLCV